MSLAPRPSISIANLDAKCRSDSFRCAAHVRPPVHRATASPSTRNTAELHTGHFLGSFTVRVRAGRRSGTIPTTSGMTSPARRMTTVSPTRTSLRVSSSMLCRVALLTVTPPTNTGSNRATGVSAPVRPTWNSMSRTLVSSSCAGNLWATAHLGARDTVPSASCQSKRLTLYTTPSMSNGKSCLLL